LWLFCYLSKRNSSFIPPFRSNLKTGRREMLGEIVCSRWLEPTSGLQKAILSSFGVTSSRQAGCGMRWHSASRQGASAGGAGYMPKESGMTSLSSGMGWSGCWSGGKGAIRIGAIKASLQPTSNAQMLWRQIPLLKKYSSRYGAGSRLSTSGSKIGLFCPACTITTCWSTNLFLVILLFTSSF
jgi:hypothetical protein